MFLLLCILTVLFATPAWAAGEDACAALSSRPSAHGMCLAWYRNDGACGLVKPVEPRWQCEALADKSTTPCGRLEGSERKICEALAHRKDHLCRTAGADDASTFWCRALLTEDKGLCGKADDRRYDCERIVGAILRANAVRSASGTVDAAEAPPPRTDPGHLVLSVLPEDVLRHVFTHVGSAGRTVTRAAAGMVGDTLLVRGGAEDLVVKAHDRAALASEMVGSRVALRLGIVAPEIRPVGEDLTAVLSSWEAPPVDIRLSLDDDYDEVTYTIASVRARQGQRVHYGTKLYVAQPLEGDEAPEELVTSKADGRVELRVPLGVAVEDGTVVARVHPRPLATDDDRAIAVMPMVRGSNFREIISDPGLRASFAKGLPAFVERVRSGLPETAAHIREGFLLEIERPRGVDRPRTLEALLGVDDATFEAHMLRGLRAGLADLARRPEIEPLAVGAASKEDMAAVWAVNARLKALAAGLGSAP